MNYAAALAFLVAAAAAPAQTFSFEVASIKQALPLSVEGIQAGRFHLGMDTNGTRADYGFVSLADLIAYAYRVKCYQVAGPGWINETRWDIEATIPAGQPADRAPEMMQRFLAARFHLAIRRQHHEQSVLALAVRKGGPQIHKAEEETSSAAVPENGLSSLHLNMEAGHMAFSGGSLGTMRISPGPNGIRIEMPAVTMAALAGMLMHFTDRPIVDATGLKGAFQVTLNFPADLMTDVPAAQKLTAFLGLNSLGAVPDTWSPAIVQAVKDLGLELTPRKDLVETIVVDRLDRMPTPN
ncbi:MAG TPA: TIGR03435 family protein [Bryobacteraceae bacterium]|nr:TIGR03435 family protein [Bryobacteraceae bacterium]